MHRTALLFVAACLFALFGALDAFDSPPQPVLISKLGAAPAPPASTGHSGILRSAGSFREILPPERFESDNASVIVLGHGDVLAKLCGDANPGGVTPLGCVRKTASGATMIVAPNPCIAGPYELYAAILCHELGHVNGWPATHGD